MDTPIETPTLVVLKTFLDRADAELLSGTLAAGEIPAFVQSRVAAGAFDFLTRAMYGNVFDVCVPPASEEAARAALADYDRGNNALSDA